MKNKILFILGVLFILCLYPTTATNCTSLNDALSKNKIMAYYSFNTNCQTDDSNNDYLLSGTPATNIPMKFGNGCSYDGVNDIGYNETIVSNLNFSDTICISYWYNNSDTSNGVFMTAFIEDAADGHAWAGLTIQNGATDAVDVSNSYDGTSQNFYRDTAYNDVADSQYHFAYCTDSRGLVTSYYRDGVYIGNDLTPVVTVTGMDYFLVGSDNFYSTFSKFRIDELWVFNCEINNATVQQIYSGAGFPSAPSTPPSLTVNSNLTTTINYKKPFYYVSYNGTITNYNGLFTCFLKNNSDILQQANNVNLTNNNLFNITLPSSTTGNYSLSIFCNGQEYNNVTAYDLKKGTLNYGNLSSLNVLNDGLNMSIQEVTGTAPINLTFNWTGIANFQALTINFKYDGNVGHSLSLRIFNYTSNVNQLIDTLGLTTAYDFMNYEFANNSDFVSGGVVKGSIEHNQAGNPSHVLYLDYLRINSANLSDDTSHVNLAWDFVPPTMTITTNFVNNSNYYDDETISYNITYFDINLFAINHTIINLDDNTIKRWDFYGNTTPDTFILNVTNSTAKLGIGNYKIIEQAWDSHTGEELKFSIKKIDDYTFEYNGIKIYSDKKLEFTKLKDKYTFTIDKKAWFCYYSPTDFIKIASNYPEHYISFKNNIWIDEYVYTFSHTNNELCFFNDKEEKYTTGSIGDLNSVYQEYYFSVIERPSLTDTLLTSIDESLNNIETDVNKIYEAIFMVGFIILWLGLWIFGYYCLQTKNELLAGTMIMLTLPIDLYFSYAFQESLMLGTGLLGIAFAVMTAWTIGIFMLIRRSVRKAV